jgi:SET family sugar efflux transporter-like MFS transporter
VTAISNVARSLYAHPAFLVLIVCNLLLGISVAFTLPFTSMFGLHEVGMGAGQFGIFMAITSLSAIAISTHLARLSDSRYSRKRMLLLGGVGGILGYLAFAWIRNVPLLCVCGSVLLGISSITFSQLFAHARNVLDSSDVEPRLVPLYMNIFRLFFALSWTVGPLISSMVMSRFSFQGIYVATAGLSFIFVLVVLFFVPDARPLPNLAAPRSSMPLRQAIQLRGMSANLVAFVLIAMCTTIGMMNLPLLIVETIHAHESAVGSAYSIAPIFEIPLFIYLGVLATRVKLVTLIRGAVLLAILYYLGLAFASTTWQIYLLQIASAAVVAVTSGIAIAFFQDILPGQTGVSTNLYVISVQLGSTIGYLLFGFLTLRFGHRFVFVACACLCAVASSLIRASGRATPDDRQMSAAID